jgi:ribonucleoside-diphosphate reductase alpha chain
LTHKFSIAGHEGYITAGLYEDGDVGEIFVTMSKQGSTISGLMDTVATAVSIALQYGVPLEVLCNKFSHTRYEPSGYTGNRDIPLAKSITDYIFRWLALRFLDVNPEAGSDLAVAAAVPAELSATEKEVFSNQADAPACGECGAIMVRSGACYKCANCGATSGCS